MLRTWWSMYHHRFTYWANYQWATKGINNG